MGLPQTDPMCNLGVLLDSQLLLKEDLYAGAMHLSGCAPVPGPGIPTSYHSWHHDIPSGPHPIWQHTLCGIALEEHLEFSEYDRTDSKCGHLMHILDKAVILHTKNMILLFILWLKNQEREYTECNPDG